MDVSTELTVAQLERLLSARRTLLESLERKRDRLHKQLSLIEARISSVGGAPGELRKPRKRPKNDRTLLAVVLEVLGQHKKGLGLSDLSAKVLETGYKTGSSKFENTVYQCLYNNQEQIYHDAANRTYRLR